MTYFHRWPARPRTGRPVYTTANINKIEDLTVILLRILLKVSLAR